MRIQLLADRILVLPCVEEKKSSIIIPDKYIDRSPHDLQRRGVVVAKGCGTRGYPMKDINLKAVILYNLGNYPKHEEGEAVYEIIRYSNITSIIE
jgi:co-chaperonin GroES (HSP10)